jgi:hypothetical protein
MTDRRRVISVDLSLIAYTNLSWLMRSLTTDLLITSSLQAVNP